MSNVSGWAGLSGLLTCDEFGDCGSQRFDVMQYNPDGDDTVVYEYTPSAAPLPAPAPES